MFAIIQIIMLFLCICFTTNAKANNHPLDMVNQELDYLAEESYVLTASRTWEQVKYSASSITIISDEEIRQMGARNLMDILRMVNGVTTTTGTINNDSITTRGSLVGTAGLLLINNHSIANMGSGIPYEYRRMPVDLIKRVEVVKGPGSALYGGNALSLVINVFTKRAQDLEGLSANITYGSDNKSQFDLLYGNSISNNLAVIFNFNYMKTDGYSSSIPKDLVTSWDENFSNYFAILQQSSRAPGNTEPDEKIVNLGLKIDYKDFELETRYIQHKWASPLFGSILNNDSYFDPNNFYARLSQQKTINDNMNFNTKLYYNYGNFSNHLNTFPVDSLVVQSSDPIGSTTGLGPLPHDLISNYAYRFQRVGMELLASIKPFKNNTLLTGLSYELSEMDNIKTQANYLMSYMPTNVPGGAVFYPLDTVQDISHIQAYGIDSSRKNWALFAEDLWAPLPQLHFALSARYDHYSDLGGELSPRASIVWEYVPGFDIKSIAGRAFRAPSLEELHSTHPLNPGFSELSFENTDMVEFSFGASPIDELKSRLTFFTTKNTLEHQVGEFTPAYAQGVEFEFSMSWMQQSYFKTHYTWQEITNEDELFFTPFIPTSLPKQSGALILNQELGRYWNLYLDYQLISDLYTYARQEESGDYYIPYDPGFNSLNLSTKLHYPVAGFGFVNAQLSVYNLLDDKQATHFDPVEGFPSGIPQSERSFALTLGFEL